MNHRNVNFFDGACSGPSVSDQEPRNNLGPFFNGDPQQPAPQLQTNCLKLGKRNMKFGTWNVRTLLQLGKPELVAAALLNYKVDIACLQEV